MCACVYVCVFACCVCAYVCVCFPPFYLQELDGEVDDPRLLVIARECREPHEPVQPGVCVCVCGCYSSWSPALYSILTKARHGPVVVRRDEAGPPAHIPWLALKLVLAPDGRGVLGVAGVGALEYHLRAAEV